MRRFLSPFLFDRYTGIGKAGAFPKSLWVVMSIKKTEPIGVPPKDKYV